MGIEVVLKTEGGEVLGEVGDPRMVLSRAARTEVFSGTRLLKYLVPWGDAVFNQAQGNDLELDIADAKSATRDSQLRALLGAIEPLAARLSREVHVYLWFMGN